MVSEDDLLMEKEQNTFPDLLINLNPVCCDSRKIFPKSIKLVKKTKNLANACW